MISVAEGIERPAQLNELRLLGCDVGQGYLLARPMEAIDLGRRFGVADVTPERAGDLAPLVHSL